MPYLKSPQGSTAIAATTTTSATIASAPGNSVPR
jgi:hypothetical protein